ncbi:hypothetical protein C2I36_13150 [Rhodobacteraceae bacterium WD3A24]|nr:hypothetical protein C2I36_13150 [Rhodobacteraceae bacterium WD3A24]
MPPHGVKRIARKIARLRVEGRGLPLLPRPRRGRRQSLSTHGRPVMSNRPRRVLIFIHAISGGAGKNAVKYANILAEGGFEVTLATGAAPQARQFGLDEARVDLRVFGTRKGLAAVGPLRREIRRQRPELCLAVDMRNLQPLRLALTGLRPRPRLILREALYTWDRVQLRSAPGRQIKRVIFAGGYRAVDRVIALTGSMAEQIEREWGVARARITVIPNGIALPGDAGAAAAPAVTAAETDVPTILCVARLTRQKRVNLLLRAFADVRARRPARLRLAGDGKLQPALQEQARALGIAEDVQFLGHVEDVGAEYRRATLTVLPSHWEGFPNVIIEALAHGVPVVATATPGAVEILDGTGCGLLAALDDPGDLARRISEALDTRFTPAALRARAEHFSDTRLSERVLAVMREEAAKAHPAHGRSAPGASPA